MAHDNGDKTVWLALRIPVRPGDQLQIIGVFDSRAGAIEACRYAHDCIGPLTVNEAVSVDEEQDWPGAFYPLASVDPAEGD